jgi:conjugal transfer pilus assembly protein TraW
MRSSDRRALAAALVLAVVAPPSADSTDRADLRALRDQAASIEEAVITVSRPGWLSEDPQREAATAGEALGRAEGRRLREQSAHRAPPGSDMRRIPKETVTLLVSRSLGPAALRDCFRTAAEPGVRAVFRGVAEGERLMDFVHEVHALLRGMDPVPSVELDPMPFRASGADAVPLMILSGPDGEIARVAGLTDPAWLRAQVAAGRVGDLGVRGPVAAIAEPDMIEEIHRRIAALDLDALRAKALASYWRRARFEHVPAATKARERRIDPTIEAKSDITLPDGRTLVRAGDRVNPLDHVPFGLRLVVFDPTDGVQVRTAQALGETAGALRPVYLATRLDRDTGWEGVRELEDTLDEPVYLLTPEVRERFALERAPATVEASGRFFLVREYPPERP